MFSLVIYPTLSTSMLLKRVLIRILGQVRLELSTLSDEVGWELIIDVIKERLRAAEFVETDVHEFQRS